MKIRCQNVTRSKRGETCIKLLVNAGEHLTLQVLCKSGVLIRMVRNIIEDGSRE